MASLFPQTWFDPQLKHAKGVNTVMGDIESLDSYPHYWKLCLVVHLLVGNFDRPAQPTQGRTFHTAIFCHSDLEGSTDGICS